MSWKGFFEGIQEFAEEVAFAPYNALRSVELESWWGANVVSWLFLISGVVAFFYWMWQLAKINASGSEDRSQISHSYLGEN
ncbi:MAG: uracil phosphoribosyltransferase [Bacteroidetes bacterium]|nr:uracil phosphoribosyltransferase [Bacteroidota bacterium]TDI74241.1 MAG: uracil phosphoribosyltransferase [Bacteroidota bacterium]